MTTYLTTADLYRQALAIADEDIVLTPEQQAALDTARTAWQSAREQVETASKARKDKDQRVAEARAVLDVATAAYEAAQQPEQAAERDRNIRADRLGEKVQEAIAFEAFRSLPTARSLRYVNSVPTDETKTDYYGTHTVYKTTLDAQPVPLWVRAYEAVDGSGKGLPFRIVARNNGATDLSFEVMALSDEDHEDVPGLRKDRFGFSAEVYHRERYRYSAKDDDAVVEVGLKGSGTSSIEDAVTRAAVLDLAITVARIVESITEEAKAK